MDRRVGRAFARRSDEAGKSDLLSPLARSDVSKRFRAGVSKWANRTILPEYEAMEQNGAFRSGTDSTVSISEESEGK